MKLAMGGNGVIAIIKLLAGIFFGSTAVLADGVDSFFDIISSASVMIGIRASEKPPDVGHPYGHGRFENFPGLIIAGSLIIAAIGIIFEAVRKMAFSDYNVFEWVVLCAALLSIGFKFQLQRHLFIVAERTGSTSIRSYARNIRGDVLTSVSVAIGVTTSALGIPWADPVAAIVVAIFIIKTGVGIGVETLHILADSSPGPEVISTIRSSAISVPGVKDCHEVRARRSGRKLFVDLHIEVDPGIDVVTSHGISDLIMEAVQKEVPEVKSVLVHVEPGPVQEDRENHLNEIEAIRAEAMKVRNVKGCHEVRLRHVGEDMAVSMHILVDAGLSITETHSISEEVSKRVRGRFKRVRRVVVHEEPEGHEHTEG